MKTKSSNRTKGIIALFILSVVWASFGIFIRILGKDFSLFQQIYLRLFAAFLFSVAFFYKDLAIKKILLIPKKDLLVLALRIICFYGIGVTLYSQAFLSTTYSNVSFLGAIPTTALLGILFLQEKITSQKIFFIFMAFIGIMLIIVKDFHHLFSFGQGDMLALIADFFFSLSYISRRWHTNYLNNKQLAVLMLGGGFTLVFLLSLADERGLVFHTTQLQPIFLVAIVISGLLNVVSVFLTNFGFKYVETFLANNIIALESFFAIFFGFFLFQEIPTLQSFIGGLLILASVILINKEEEKK